MPLASEYDVHIGVTGREPLNNQPYFRMTALGDGTPVHTKSRPAFDYMMGLIKELEGGDSQAAREALRAFIAVRQQYWPRYTTASGHLTASAESLASRIDTFVRENSESGARATRTFEGRPGTVHANIAVEPVSAVLGKPLARAAEFDAIVVGAPGLPSRAIRRARTRPPCPHQFARPT